MTFNARNPAFFPVVVGVALAGPCERPSPAGRPGNVGSSSVWLGLPGASPSPLLGCAGLFTSTTQQKTASRRFLAPVASGLIIQLRES